jgi:hypothetical protein
MGHPRLAGLPWHRSQQPDRRRQRNPCQRAWRKLVKPPTEHQTRLGTFLIQASERNLMYFHAFAPESLMRIGCQINVF